MARKLAARLGRRVLWALPPAEAKDVRDWLTADARGDTPWPDRGRELASHLIETATAIDPPDDPPAGAAVPDDGPNDSPDNPHRLAAGFLASPPGGVTSLVRYWRGEWYRYAEGVYRPVAENDLRAELTAWIRGEFVRLCSAGRATQQRQESDRREATVRPVTTTLVSNAMQALRGCCLIPSSVEPPAWIDGVTGPEAGAMLSVRNGLLDLRALADGRGGCLLPPTPSYFTLTGVPFSFEADPPPPTTWLRFLSDLWPDDPESVAALQDWFGYLLTADTSQQKILLVIGPKRSGKGTIVRVLRELLGPANVAGPTLASLASNFGLSPLLGKLAAVVSDARLGNRADTATITERLLAISGEDSITIDRKFLDQQTVKLGTRFLILSNELPSLADASGALAGRLIVLRLTNSFYGREDPRLFDRLRDELAGILAWAVEGWRRLRARGYFTQPSTGAELVGEMTDLSSPVGAFVRARCVVGPTCRVEVASLYDDWRTWCEENGHKDSGAGDFGRSLRAAVPTIEKQRPWVCGQRANVYVGIGLRTASDYDVPSTGPSGHSGHGDLPLHTMRTEKVEEGRKHGSGTQGNAIRGHRDHCDHLGNAGSPDTLFPVAALPD